MAEWSQELTALAVVHAVYEYLPLRRLEEAAGEVHEGRFPRPRLTDDGHGGPGGYLEVEVREHVLASVGIAEGDVAKLDVAPYGLPVLALPGGRRRRIFR